MLTRRRLAAAALAFLAATSPALAQGKKGAGSGMGQSGGGDAVPQSPGQVFDVAGRYAARGLNADGTSYSGDVEIQQAGTRIAIQWQIGSDSYSGEGLIDGRIVAVDWGDEMPVVYVVMPDGELHGTWGDGEALEKLIPR